MDRWMVIRVRVEEFTTIVKGLFVLAYKSAYGLPERVCDLYYLQVLLLHGCEKLVSLPKSFAKLVNLRHLDISDTPMLKKLPSGIGGMTRLQVLSKVIIEGSNRFNISKLKGKMELRGRLSIEGLHKVKDARQAEERSLNYTQSILKIWCWNGVMSLMLLGIRKMKMKFLKN
ncbi:putative disease resistance RPP13-like protein 1 [Tanacetum coccineum]